MKSTHYPIGLLLGLTLLASCKKPQDTAPTPAPVPVSVVHDVRDSVYHRALELFLWNTALPSMAAFKPTSYATPEDVMKKVRTYSPTSANYGNVDRWSFAVPKAAWDAVASGVEGDFGTGFGFMTENDLRITYVYKNSDAAGKGVQRGWKVVSIGGVQGLYSNLTGLNDALDKSSVVFVFEKPDGSQQTLTLNATTYQSNPVLTRTVFSEGGRKVGYIAFNSFLGSTASAELDEAFAYFKSNGVNELIFDERYNGGGYVSLAEKLANLIAPAAVAGKFMYKDTHNQRYTSWNRTKNFDAALPANNLNLSRVVFITTRRTASASELLINVLKPYMDVKVVGNDTYGKPAGYYPLPVTGELNGKKMDYYSLPLAVKQVNAAGYGEFYDGLPADLRQADDLTRNFGDASEGLTRQALNYLTLGKFMAVPAGGRALATETLNKSFDKQLKLMLFDLPKR